MLDRFKRKFSRSIRLDAIAEEAMKASMEALDGVKFNTAIRGATWLENIGFYPGGWAADYRLLTILFRVLNDIGPTSVLEFGLGESTRMLAAYRSGKNPSAEVFTVEHNKEWQEFLIAQCPLFADINIVNTAMERKIVHGESTNFYSGLVDALPQGRKFDLLLIDGPIGTPRYSRYNMVEVVEADLLADDFILFLDDAARPGEMETIAIAEEKLRSKGIEFNSAFLKNSKKGIYTAHSKKFSFLATI